MHYTYLHRSAKTNEIFYIGKGIGKRAYVKNNRNIDWHNIVDNEGYQIEILGKWKTNEEALEHEKFLILCAKDLNWPLTNKTSGGQGALGNQNWLGKTHSLESKEKIRLGNLGQKRRSVDKMKIANQSINNPNWQGTWITPDGVFNTCREVAKHYGIDARTVRARCKGYKEQLVNSIKTYPPKNGWGFKAKDK